jgi:two-component system LytT family response regulator
MDSQQPRFELFRIAVLRDRRATRSETTHVLQNDDELNIVWEGRLGDGMGDEMLAHNPELVIVDLGEGSTLSLPEAMVAGGPHAPFLIVIAPDERHAVRAFRAHALDYLVHPVTDGSIRSALEWAKTNILRKRSHENNGGVTFQSRAPETRPFHVDRLMVKERGHIILLKINEIDLIEAYGGYVRVHSLQKKHLLRGKIGDVEQQLPPNQFIRIHRSTIVNIDRIREIRQGDHGDYQVVLTDGGCFTLSRSFRERVFQRFARAS